MPRYTVMVQFTQSTPITVYARDEAEAVEKAVNVVLRWPNVDDAEATDCTELSP